jgi:hypothetical protein
VFGDNYLNIIQRIPFSVSTVLTRIDMCCNIGWKLIKWIEKSQGFAIQADGYDGRLFCLQL